MISDALKTRLEVLAGENSAAVAEKFDRYTDLLIEYNQKFNLTAVTDPAAVEVKHYLDSLSAAELIPFGAAVLDVGSGAGFPGIPLALVRPDIRLVAVDSVGKKTDFLRVVAALLGLDNVVPVHARIEEFFPSVALAQFPATFPVSSDKKIDFAYGDDKKNSLAASTHNSESNNYFCEKTPGNASGKSAVSARESKSCNLSVSSDKKIDFAPQKKGGKKGKKNAVSGSDKAAERAVFDVVVSRAVAPLATLAEYCLPFVRPGGIFIAYKARGTEDELAAASSALRTLGGKVEKILSANLSLPSPAVPPETNTVPTEIEEFCRRLAVIRKVGSSPAAYPRPRNLPRLKPL